MFKLFKSIYWLWAQLISKKCLFFNEWFQFYSNFPLRTVAAFKAILRIVKWFFTKNVEFCTTMHIRWALNSIITLFLVTRVDSSHRAFYYALRSQRVATTVWNDSPVVQSVERRTVNPYVTGSSPVRGAIFSNSTPNSSVSLLLGNLFFSFCF